jgi:L-threonylcarbamoyladenylate synthase
LSCTVLSVDAAAPDATAIARAAEIVRAGGLVAFPTETVYGLGANALDVAAVAGIFSAKGRPATNPIIVHASGVEHARSLVADWPPAAQQLAERFWPGPLTLVLPRRAEVPDLVSAGGPTVGVRVPAHPVALALLRAARVPIAAPSANRSTQLSPTRAEHVVSGLADRIDLVLDAGPTAGGLESTVLDMTTQPPTVLRPGLVSVADLEAVLGHVVIGDPPATDQPARAPGQMPRHYAPRTPLELVTGCGLERVLALVNPGYRVAWVPFGRHPSSGLEVVMAPMPDDPTTYAARLYAVLHELDRRNVDRIILELPPATDEWLAIHDRLRRAAAN